VQASPLPEVQEPVFEVSFDDGITAAMIGSGTSAGAKHGPAKAVDGVIERFPGGNLALVSHGTVITLFVSRAVGAEPMPFWKRLDLPAFVVLSLPDLSLLNVVERV